jgi:hypothetical protein
MCRVFRLVFLGALLALPLSAAQKAEPSLTAFLQSLNPAATAQNTQICTQGLPGCNCVPDTICTVTYTDVSFVRQKPNTVCVYQCTKNTSCNDSCGNPSSSTDSFFRVRSAENQYGFGQCPAADINFCSTMQVGE